MLIWSDLHYFKAAEFDSPGVLHSGLKMNLAFVAKLDKIREACKVPLQITSGYRTPEHNAAIPDSVDGSVHTTGHAADIAAPSSALKFAILEAALRLGFTRIGIGVFWLHRLF